MNRSFPAAPARLDAATIDVGRQGSAPSLPAHARFACRVDAAAMAGDLDPLVEKAVRLVAAAAPTTDAILGPFIAIAALIRSVSFHEGRLLEEAMIAIGRRNPDLEVLGSGVRLPVTPAALEAVAHNRAGALKGLSFDADAKARGSYAPDLVTVNRRYRSALVIDVKRSLASYLDTHRLAELKVRMLAASLILPDWLYEERKRLTVESVGIAIVDGSSGVSEHEAGLWSLSEIDDLLEIDGAAAAMMGMRERFAARVQTLIEAELLRLSRPIIEAEDQARVWSGDGGALGTQNAGAGVSADTSGEAGGKDFGAAPSAFSARSSRTGDAPPRRHAPDPLRLRAAASPRLRVLIRKADLA